MFEQELMGSGRRLENTRALIKKLKKLNEEVGKKRRKGRKARTGDLNYKGNKPADVSSTVLVPMEVSDIILKLQ